MIGQEGAEVCTWPPECAQIFPSRMFLEGICGHVQEYSRGLEGCTHGPGKFNKGELKKKFTTTPTHD